MTLSHQAISKAVIGFVLCVIAPVLINATTPAPILWINFDDSLEYSKESKDFRTRLLEHMHLSLSTDQGVGNSQALKATYVGESQGSARIVSYGNLPNSLTKASLCFDVKFEKDFQFVKGGKLHGLGPTRSITGGNAIQPDGWSARGMWKAGGKLDPYIYHQKQAGQYGEAGVQVKPFAFQSGKYHTICYYVEVNSPASESNGAFRIYADGELIQRKDNIQYRMLDGAASEITRVHFSTFHGGSEPSWAPKTLSGEYATVHAYFDNMAVYAEEFIRHEPWTGPSMSVLGKPDFKFSQRINQGEVFSIDGRRNSSLDWQDVGATFILKHGRMLLRAGSFP